MKGENALVRLQDEQAFLIDFGSASYHGADTLTWQVFPPGTPAYRSPEAIAFAVNILRSPVKQYTARPSDDVFALGVTGYRLVTGQYPPTADPLDEGVHVWQEGGSGPQPVHELNERCCPELSGLLSRMLSLRPEARGSARELLLYVLLEHQSSVDRWMALRMLRYVVRLLEHWREAHPDSALLPVVVALVMYHGPEGHWTAPQRVEEIFDVPEEERALWQALVPRFEYLLDDLTAAREEALLAREGPPLARLAFLALRHGRTDGLALRLPKWA